ncbi:hypothetical protein [Mangrovibacterium diazotrophicum]|uniref:HEAT repeat protein n=1 Tax=Mangrovibacterium diazotrophicum TaxID=1261403 RepID=A0A419W8N9_9BACT|nr:hypothetical protein [Mangrovibacterium diazotrophicum]RKD91816.1 hypothetical protein BC643_2182 [Mangrovibacterium diazotrophicum]
MTTEEIKQLITDWPNRELIFEHFLRNEDDFPSLLEVAFDDSKAINWRAAWIVDHLNEQNKPFVATFLPQIIATALKSENSSKLRHFLKIISLHPIPPVSVGLLFDRAFTIFTAPRYPVAVRVHALQILYKIARTEKELIPELVQTIENELDLHPSAGLKSRGKRILKALRSQTGC